MKSMNMEGWDHTKGTNKGWIYVIQLEEYLNEWQNDETYTHKHNDVKKYKVEYVDEGVVVSRWSRNGHCSMEFATFVLKQQSDGINSVHQRTGGPIWWWDDPDPP